MKPTRAVGMMAAAIVFGLAAVALAAQWLKARGGPGTSPVVVAAADLNLGQRLGADMLKVVDWPATAVPPGAVADASKLQERVLRTSVTRGEAVLESKLAPVGTKGGLSALIDEGRRAITVRVNDVIGVAGFALPGNYVDIIVSTHRDPAPGERETDQQSISKIVLERILVLAVAQEVSRDDTKPHVVNAVTLEVTPEQAEKLDLARSVGSLSLVLRNQIDERLADTNGATKRSLLADTPPPATGKPKAPPKPVLAAVAKARVCAAAIDGLHQSQECF